MDKLTSHRAIIFLSVIISAVVATYLYEDAQPTSDYFEYYGNVTTLDDYHFPDRLSAYTFGKSHVGPLKMSFVNRLLCQSTDGTHFGYRLIATRYKEFDAFIFGNPIPPEITQTIKASDSTQQIGLADENVIRHNGNEYGAWNMGEVRPYHDSECYIDTDITTYSTIFGLPKSLRFAGNAFKYYTTLRPTDGYISPYDVWSRKNDVNAGRETVTLEE